jgi:hypothetical protein
MKKRSINMIRYYTKEDITEYQEIEEYRELEEK